MKYIDFGTNVSLIEVDPATGKPVRNRWQWTWMEETNQEGQTVMSWCKKIDQPGKCFCVACNQTLLYGSSGKKALLAHANQSNHIKKVSSLKINCGLAGAAATIETKDSFHDRKNEVKSVLSLFIAEHCLLFSIGPELLGLAKRLGKDLAALNSTTLSRTSTTYTLTHGVAKNLQTELKEKLKDAFFSLNVDEATNNTGNKVLNVLISHFDESFGQVVPQLLGSRRLKTSTAGCITDAIDSVLSDYNLKWQQVISVLTDNCNVMRGSKEGVTARIKSRNPCILASDLYYDLEDSPKFNSLFNSVQALLLGTLSVIQPISNRFLQMNVVADRLWHLWDALILFYGSFLSDAERKSHAKGMRELYAKYNLSKEDVNSLEDCLKVIRKSGKTDAGKQRGVRILTALFNWRDRKGRISPASLQGNNTALQFLCQEVSAQQATGT